MIILQVTSLLILVAIIVTMYAVAIKMLYEHRQLHKKKKDKSTKP
jgi:cell division protein FtsL